MGVLLPGQYRAAVRRGERRGVSPTCLTKHVGCQTRRAYASTLALHVLLWLRMEIGLYLVVPALPADAVRPVSRGVESHVNGRTETSVVRPDPALTVTADPQKWPFLHVCHRTALPK